MNKWVVGSLVVSQLLGGALSLLSFFIAAFASDSGAADPVGARLSALMIWVPAVFFVCLIVSWGLLIARREKIALALSAIPFAYFLAAFVIAG